MLQTKTARTRAFRTRLLIGTALGAAFCFQCYQIAVSRPATTARAETPRSNVAYAAPVRAPLREDPFEQLARTDPLRLFREAVSRYERSVHDYTCTFTKQERVGNGLTAEQVTHVKFREKPYSVNMLWVQNADKARRAIYVEGKWHGKNGEKLASVEPAGSIARLFVDNVFRPIDGPDAKKAARRQIDQFGFGKSLDLIVRYCERAAGRNELTLRYVGEGRIDGRPTHIIERILPYDGDEALYPDRVLEVQLDKETLLPACCTAYADDARTKLLGRYLITDVKFNVGLTDRDFDPDAQTD